ncbi:MAG: TolC family protein, partial [Acidobacteria bacterium]|nr:TolC family protein [Acidobacteriota bacterium]
MLSFLVLWPGWACGQQSLSLEQAVQLALAQNPLLGASQAAQDAAQQRRVQARGSYFPEVNYAESFQWGTNPVYVFGSLLEQHRFRAGNFDLGSLNRPDSLTNFSSQLTVNQPLFDGHKTRYRLRAASAAHNLAGEQRRQAEMDLLEAVAETYLGAVVAQEETRVAEEAFETAQADLERARAMRDAGMTTDADVLSMQVHVAEVEDQRIRSRNHLALARARLNDLLAVPLDAAYTLSTPLRPVAYTPPALEQFEDRAA